ncbi:MAG: hypothetical protein AB7G28_11360 [Pirellulales bacterium]
MKLYKSVLFFSAPLMVGAALLAGSSAALADTIVFSDDFNVPNGPLNGTTPDIGTGVWAATAAASNPIQIASQEVALVNTGEDSYAAFTAPVPATAGKGILSSLDITVTAASAGGDYFFHLSNPAGTTSIFLERLFARSSGNGFQLGLLDTSGTGSTTTWGTTVLDFGTKYSVDVLWNFVAGASNDTFAVSVNDAPYLTHSWTSVNAEPAALAAVNFRQGGSSTFPTVYADNLVVTSVPEPTTVVLASLMGACCVLFRRRVA